MAVFTKINKKDFTFINQKFDNKFLSFQGIKKGIENTNYLLKSKNNKYGRLTYRSSVSAVFLFLRKPAPDTVCYQSHAGNKLPTFLSAG